ncbi:branched-chain amino acid ABC transporter permease [Acrocarpospora catenulata]|uniref:branched-chain amino acid ABC transporter permease n=1 Tax=Acrocarpospora catenulata TaxID=2836182 RepID=UPI001BDB54DC|nr:branched-chain amino acid ABC transporter permease [Acrocarpospora catenulata]
MTELGQYLANGLVSGAIYVLVALGLAIVFSTLDVVNFAHGQLFMLGGYAAYVCVVSLDLPYLLSLPVAALVLAVVGLVIERLVFRPLYDRPHLDMILVSVGLIQIFQYGASWIWGIEAREVPTGMGPSVEILGTGMFLSRERLLLIAVATLLIPVVALLLQRTLFGKALHAIADDEEGAATVGIHRPTFASLAFIAGAALAGLAGALLAPISLVSPSSGAEVVIKAFVILIVGGIGSIRGAISAGVLLGLAEAVLGGYLGYRYVDVFAFGLVIIALIVRPQGLLGRATRPV